MPRNGPELVPQLNALLRLTAAEAVTARSRRSQAASERVRDEVAAMAQESDAHSRALVSAIRDLDAVPDVVGAAMARASAAARVAAERGAPLSEVLLADLTRVQQVAARARFTNIVAEQGDSTPVVQLAERLEADYTERADWFMTRLAEFAIG